MPSPSTPTAGLLITFEGPDGCGKTTQWERGVSFLREQYPHRRIVATRNPGGTAFGAAIRQLILAPRPEGEANVEALAELLLYMADRAQHVGEQLKPELAAGSIILCDRFVDSSVAYQGAARGLPAALIQQLNRLVCGEVWPHATLYFSAPIEVLAERRAKRDAAIAKDRLELEGLAFQAKVQAGFEALAAEEPHRFRRIDATASLESVSLAVQNELRTLLG